MRAETRLGVGGVSSRTQYDCRMASGFGGKNNFYEKFYLTFNHKLLIVYE